MPQRQPPEWAPHQWVWIGFPSHADLWQEDLAPAREEVVSFAAAVHAGGAGEEVRLVAADAESAAAAKAMAPFATIVEQPFGDIWLRDTGPIILKGSGGGRSAVRFLFNGWGGKYDLPGDKTVGLRLAETMGVTASENFWVLEGGAIDVDGTGLAVTTEECLLNPNRNPGMTKSDIEQRLREDLGIDRVLWLSHGLVHDHTDGHVDNLARFVGEGRIAIPEPAIGGDPNGGVYREAIERAEDFGLKVEIMPSPGRILTDGVVVPASYMNFYIGNAAVVVPLYGAANDDKVLAKLEQLFPGRRIVGLRAGHILTGGGSFHCISQQVPA